MVKIHSPAIIFFWGWKGVWGLRRLCTTKSLHIIDVETITKENDLFKVCRKAFSFINHGTVYVKSKIN